MQCGLLGGASPWEGKSGAEVGIVNRKVARRARRANIPPEWNHVPHFPYFLTLLHDVLCGGKVACICLQRSCLSPNQPLNLGQRHLQRHLQVVPPPFPPTAMFSLHSFFPTLPSEEAIRRRQQALEQADNEGFCRQLVSQIVNSVDVPDIVPKAVDKFGPCKI